ncbi:sigma-70 family RNA polymerase sigma factor [Amycolatopsis echigonensis]|uniref:RNA polymerase sigma-70 factor (ECF subfamily) n=1 Tax=Amycolatopsis echigonensis TaxID=2576905 RepID=A0A2N3WI66_9PSEU|nr:MULTISPECIES: sigma-70 family RNA polymerase sigma factor [Amycolatopsis]MBB2499454.1 sigma-70 family RNA polymerase sigma factor [Amycolatopsis echigonensis]PKV93551.1 RNA polymerase sigma-70 factor (ECF subfamily) [Amycolatopsis niigatensis]
MDRKNLLAAQFEEERPRLRGVAYRMLGSLAEADDAVQEAWLRVDSADISEVRNLPAWLTTVVARVCLNLLRTRERRREDSLDAFPLDRGDDSADLAEEAQLAESVGLAMLVVLDVLGPAERIAFVLHDLFAVPFEDIAQILDRSPAAVRQLASRARRRVRGGEAGPADASKRRGVVEAYLAAAREGDFAGLLKVLAPDVVLHSDTGAAPVVLRGVRAVSKGALLASEVARSTQVALVDGVPGLVLAPRGRLAVVLKFVFDGDLITGIDVISAPERLRGLEIALG